MALGVVVDDHAWVEEGPGIHQGLELGHDGLGLGAPLGLHEGGHVAARAVLGLEGTVVLPHHQLHHIVDEALVALHGGLVVEGLGDDEVEVAVLGVAEDDGLVIAVPGEELGEIHGGVRQALDGEGHVLDEHRGAPLADRAHGGEGARADLPHHGLLDGIVGEVGRLQQLEARSRRQGLALQVGADGLLAAVELHQQGGGAVRQGLEAGGYAGLVLHGPERRPIQQLQGSGPGIPQGDDGGAGGVEVGEEQEARDLHRQVRHRVQHGLGDEGQGAFGAHQEVAEDVDGPVEVYEGVEGIARGVLGLVLGPDALSQGRIAQQVGLHGQQALGEGGLGGPELGICIRCPAVDDRAGGQDEGE